MPVHRNNNNPPNNPPTMYNEINSLKPWRGLAGFARLCGAINFHLFSINGGRGFRTRQTPPDALGVLFCGVSLAGYSPFAFEMGAE